MNLLTNKKIAIVGGGPGGLTLARLLQLNGAAVSVYERDGIREARNQGATLDLHEESGLKALKMAALMDAFMTNYRPGAEKLRIVDKNAQLFLDEHATEKIEIARPEIDRGPLTKILLDSLQPGTVVWNSRFAALTPQNESWKLTFQNGTSALADLVIAADGANSTIRPYITPSKPFFVGITLVEGIIYQAATASPTLHALVNGGKVFALDDDKSLIVSAKGDDSLVFYTGCKTDQNWVQTSGIDFSDKAQVLTWFQTEFSGWSAIWAELIANATPPFVPRPQYCMPLNQRWEALPNLTMLGDAAHLMPPYAGEGVNMAMLDALELSNCLTSHEFPDVQSAIAAYEEQMRPRAADVASMTLESTESLHAPRAIPYLLNIVG